MPAMGGGNQSHSFFQCIILWCGMEELRYTVFLVHVRRLFLPQHIGIEISEHACHSVDEQEQISRIRKISGKVIAKLAP